METRSWSDLPLELLEMILSKLPYLDHPYFASVCKNWHQITSPVVVYPAKNRPLLVYFKDLCDGFFYLYSPSFNKTFRVNWPFNVPYSDIHFSKDGWLVLYRQLSEDEAEVILANPITNALHRFPGLSPMRGAIAFFGCPPNDCVIFAIESCSSDSVLIRLWDKKGWHSFEASNSYQFVMSPDTSPVVYGDSFVCLGRKGNIGFYDYHKNSWNILGKRGHFDVSFEVHRRYLVEYEGELLAVLTGWCNSPTEILRLNKQAMSWERVSSLGYHTLFVGPQVSILANLSMEGMENIVFRSQFLGFPETISAELRTSGGQIVFVPKYSPRCSLEEGRMETTKRYICTYDLRSGWYSRYAGSSGYAYSIWYDTKTARKLCPSSSSHEAKM